MVENTIQYLPSEDTEPLQIFGKSEFQGFSALSGKMLRASALQVISNQLLCLFEERSTALEERAGPRRQYPKPQTEIPGHRLYTILSPFRPCTSDVLSSQAASFPALFGSLPSENISSQDMCEL